MKVFPAVSPNHARIRKRSIFSQIVSLMSSFTCIMVQEKVASKAGEEQTPFPAVVVEQKLTKASSLVGYKLIS